MEGKTDNFYEILSSRVFPLKCTANNYISHSCLQPDGCRVCVENIMLIATDIFVCLSWTFFENAS